MDPGEAAHHFQVTCAMTNGRMCVQVLEFVAEHMEASEVVHDFQAHAL